LAKVISQVCLFPVNPTLVVLVLVDPGLVDLGLAGITAGASAPDWSEWGWTGWGWTGWDKTGAIAAPAACISAQAACISAMITASEAIASTRMPTVMVGRTDPVWPEPGWPEPGWPEPGWPEPGWPEADSIAVDPAEMAGPDVAARSIGGSFDDELIGIPDCTRFVLDDTTLPTQHRHFLLQQTG